jgi:exopolysaccharide biosynthesis predicted pyruvyltransferase EpsI
MVIGVFGRNMVILCNLKPHPKSVFIINFYFKVPKPYQIWPKICHVCKRKTRRKIMSY